MKTSLSMVLAGAFLASASLSLTGVARAHEGHHASETAPTPAQARAEARLAKIVEGRTAGAPVDCIVLQQINSTEIVDGTAIVYRMNNGTIYVNRPPSGANFLRRDLVLVTDTHSPNLCGVDIVRLLDSTSRMGAGSVGLGKFVPYPRPAR